MLFICAIVNENWDYRDACRHLPEYRGSGCCVLHFTGEDKGYDFEEAKQFKLAHEDYDFSGAVFPNGSTNFSGKTFGTTAKFIGTRFLDRADFAGAEFNGERTYFDDAEFSGWQTDFSEAQFGAEMTSFSGTHFIGGVTFEDAQFSGDTDFNEVKFSGGWTEFSGARFCNKIFFREAVFDGGVAFFTRAKFSGEWTDFSKAKFHVNTYFSETQFGHDTHYLETLFGAEADFSEALFCGDDTTFTKAKFEGKTDFSKAKFRGNETYFSEARFGGEATDFSEARFRGWFVSFSRAQFNGADTTFQDAVFKQWVLFDRATFGERVSFLGSKDKPVFTSKAWASFDNTRIEKPELVTFHTVSLRSGWFINANIREVDFTDVNWYGLPYETATLKNRVREATEAFKKSTLKQAWKKVTATALDEEIGELEAHGVSAPHTLLAQACRRLSANAEDNREYPLANEFHYWSMDALRKQGWRGLGLVGTLYWALSGYGVRAARAFDVLVAMWAAFTTLYVLVDPPEFKNFGQGLEYVWQAAVYSLLALVRLNPEPRPEDPGVFQFLVGLEGILGPLQIALLALAIRRKVMR